MADTTATTVTELVESEMIEPVINEAAKARAVVTKFFKDKDLTAMGSSPTASFPQEVSDVGTESDYDDPGESTDYTALAFETVAVNITAAEYGIARTVTDISVEDNILGMTLYQYLVESAAEDLAIVVDSDGASLLDAFATTVGATTVDLSLANMAQAMIELRNNQMRIPDGAVYNLGNSQGQDYDQALLASTGTQLANYYTKPEEANGLDGYLGTFMRAEVWTSSLTDTANTGADDTGGLYARGDAGKNPRSAALALVRKRDIRVEYERSAIGRSMDIVSTRRAAVGEVIDLSGVSIITDL